MHKHYISASQLLEDSYRMAWQVYQSGFRPDYIVGVWRGGAPVGIAVQELLDVLGVKSDHIAIRTSSYTGIGERNRHVLVHGLNYLIKRVESEDSLLIVDDEELVLDVGVNMLEKLGYTVLEAHNGTEGVEIFKANHHKIKMVILDIIMPDMGGGETYDRIKAINPRVKVLLSSGYGANEKTNELLRRGCCGFIQKPFNMVGLSEKIEEVLTSP